jgi:hypothetical protein
MLESWHIRPVSFKHYQRFAADLLGRAPRLRDAGVISAAEFEAPQAQLLSRV